jgi:hypothetical protein
VLSTSTPLRDLLASSHLAIRNDVETLALEDAPNVGQIVAASAASSSQGMSSKRSGTGGSVYLTYVNHQKRAFKEHIGDRKMTTEELRQVERDAKQEWASLDEASREAWAMRYRADVHKRQRGEKHTQSDNGGIAYKKSFGIGEHGHFISPTYFCKAPCAVLQHSRLQERCQAQLVPIARNAIRIARAGSWHHILHNRTIGT